MLGLTQSFVNEGGADVQMFTSGGVVNYSGASVVFQPVWQIWRKPAWARCVWISAGGGGGAGGTGANTGAAGGAGEGGPGGEYRCGLYPAIMLPDILYIQIGQGGQQPTSLVSGTTGPNGAHTFVSYDPLPNTATVNTSILIMAGGGNSSVVSVANTTLGAQAGSTAGFLTNIAMQPRSGMGTWVGNTAFSCIGTNGGAPDNPGESPGYITSFRCYGPNWCGAGGGGTPGGSPAGNGAVCSDSSTDSGIVRGVLKQYAPERLLSQAAGMASGATPAGDGADGFVTRFLWQHYGGHGGGGASNTAGGVAGDGGNGILGSGGGGGGGSNSSNPTLGRPGNGGDGYVMIMSW